MSDKNLLRVRVSAKLDDLLKFLAEHPRGCERIEADGGDHYTIDVFLRVEDFESLRREKGFTVRALFNVATRMGRLVKQVGKGDRFAGGRLPPPLVAPIRRNRP